MLQVKDLVKRYTTKGETVVALDHVSVAFPEKGMVFLLGKSGSGKSTLLNVSGGLDAPDEGEVIVNGKSSRDFTPADFDSYRNTYLGFVFQEYNILSELTVGENVALALELQGKPRDMDRVRELLAQVDLEGFADRRPNTLSGGQKQRVAIARALVKEPEIIMADEPTGALDSATGEQVFDTLKKLSREKLVVVVSHDREFAERYADRIIELRDGRIVSDLTRGEPAEEIPNVVEAQGRLSVRACSDLTAEDEQKILAFVRKRKGVVISAEESDDTPASAGFGRTREQPVPSAESSASFIKSKFPLRYAVKMGLSGLRMKPVRLAFTTLLAVVAFMVFGVFSTLITYSTQKIAAATLASSHYQAAVLEKHGIVHIKNGEAEYTNDIDTSEGNLTHFSEAEVEEISAKTGVDFIPVYTMEIGATIPFAVSSQVRPSSEDTFYWSYIKEFMGFADASRVQDGTVELLAGEFPSGESECMVSRAVYETFEHYGYYRSENRASDPVETYEDLIGKTISIFNSSHSDVRNILVTVTGVFDAHDDFSRFDALREENDGMRPADWVQLGRDLQEAYRYSLSSLCFVGEGFYEAYAPADTDLLITSNVSNNVRLLLGNLPGGATASSNFYTERGGGWGGWGPLCTVNPEAVASGARYQYLFAPLGNRSATATALFAVDCAENAQTDVDYRAPYSFMTGVRNNEQNFGKVYAVLGTAACVLAVFAALLLYNFISASINAKKKDIGILRAVGARGIDVLKIFMVEGIIISLLCFALGSLGSLAACAIANPVLVAAGVMEANIFLFDGLNALIVLALTTVASVVATVVPVTLAVRKKPVEAIRSV